MKSRERDLSIWRVLAAAFSQYFRELLWGNWIFKIDQTTKITVFENHQKCLIQHCERSESFIRFVNATLLAIFKYRVYDWVHWVCNVHIYPADFTLHAQNFDDFSPFILFHYYLFIFFWWNFKHKSDINSSGFCKPCRLFWTKFWTF